LETVKFKEDFSAGHNANSGNGESDVERGLGVA
jgi:hypothetical protein